MRSYLALTAILALFVCACTQHGDHNGGLAVASSKMKCSPLCKAKNKPGELTCKLSPPEIRERKETVLASLKAQMLEKKELSDGYAFKFAGTDAVVDELTEFIKTERQCCDFFVFGLSVSGDKSEAWLELTGPEGAKEFIQNELEL